MAETIIHMPPPILTHYDRYLLDPLAGMKYRVENEITALASKKIRSQDTGKQKEFNRLLKKFEETYERKKVEEKEYNEKIKNFEKRPYLSSTGGIVMFRRMDS